MLHPFLNNSLPVLIANKGMPHTRTNFRLKSHFRRIRIRLMLYCGSFGCLQAFKYRLELCFHKRYISQNLYLLCDQDSNQAVPKSFQFLTPTYTVFDAQYMRQQLHILSLLSRLFQSNWLFLGILSAKPWDSNRCHAWQALRSTITSSKKRTSKLSNILFTQPGFKFNVLSFWLGLIHMLHKYLEIKVRVGLDCVVLR